MRLSIDTQQYCHITRECPLFSLDVVEDLRVYLDRQANSLNKPLNVDMKQSDNPNILTSSDIVRVEQGLPLGKYDAYILFDDADIEFATTLIGHLEDHGFKVNVRSDNSNHLISLSDKIMPFDGHPLDDMHSTHQCLRWFYTYMKRCFIK